MDVSSQENPFTVSVLTGHIKSLVEGSFTKIFVEGEISGWRPAASGHVYFTLKDASAQISAVMFRSAFERCRARASLKDGAKVIVYANATVYAPRGQYQLNVLAARLTGEGDLMQRYLELKARLEAEGLFDAARKRPLPFLPRRIGLVTSPSGAVVHDMCRVLMRRFPALEVRIFPAVVQGDAAPPTIVAGLRHFGGCADWRADLVIVARGGGSFEDLFCFNDESVVRAVAECPVPVVSAVGHETDFTLCDFAADVRAGTPSMAAELAVPVLAELRRKLELASSSLAASLRGKYEWYAQRVDGLSDSLASSLRGRSEWCAQRLAGLSALLAPALMRFEANLRRRVEVLDAKLAPATLRHKESELRRTVEVLGAKLALLSPFSVLDRGYSLTTDAAGRVVRSASDAKPGDEITTRLRDGSLVSKVVAAR
jgi:exodeoxyribonuclease VII large subunit